MKKIKFTMGVLSVSLLISSNCYAIDMIDITQSVDTDNQNIVVMELDGGNINLAPTSIQQILNNNSVGSLNLDAKLDITGSQEVSVTTQNRQINALIYFDGDFLGTTSTDQTAIGNNLVATHADLANPSQEINLDDVTQMFGAATTEISITNVSSIGNPFLSNTTILETIDDQSQTLIGNNVTVRSNSINGNITQTSNTELNIGLAGATNELLYSDPDTVEIDSIGSANQIISLNNISATADADKLSGIYSQTDTSVSTMVNVIDFENLTINGGDMVTSQSISGNHIASSGVGLDLSTSQAVVGSDGRFNSLLTGLGTLGTLDTDGTLNFTQTTSGNSHSFEIK